MNVGQPGASWSKSAIRQLFNHADKTGFKLFFSLDFLQTGDINAFTPVLNDYIHRKSYMTAGPNNYPVVSSFGTGNYGPQDFKSWKTNNFQGKIYFLPNTDRLPEFYNPSNWFKTWGSVVDGVFNWETAWPAGSETPRNVSDAFDHAVQTAAHANKKTYMAREFPIILCFSRTFELIVCHINQLSLLSNTKNAVENTTTASERPIYLRK